MNLPSNVARYDSVPLPMFDLLEARYIRPDASRTLRAWAKAEEVERRLDAFEWLCHVARRPMGIESFVLDFSTAFLMSLESALQVLGEEKATQFKLEDWLKSQPANDMTLRGLRTLRHLEAHVRAGQLIQRPTGGHSRFAGVEGGSTVGWRWAPIGLTDFRALRTPRIEKAELAQWNQILETRLIMDLMRDGVTQVLAIFTAAES